MWESPGLFWPRRHRLTTGLSTGTVWLVSDFTRDVFNVSKRSFTIRVERGEDLSYVRGQITAFNFILAAWVQLLYLLKYLFYIYAKFHQMTNPLSTSNSTLKSVSPRDTSPYFFVVIYFVRSLKDSKGPLASSSVFQSLQLHSVSDFIVFYFILQPPAILCTTMIY